MPLPRGQMKAGEFNKFFTLLYLYALGMTSRLLFFFFKLHLLITYDKEIKEINTYNSFNTRSERNEDTTVLEECGNANGRETVLNVLRE